MDGGKDGGSRGFKNLLENLPSLANIWTRWRFKCFQLLIVSFNYFFMVWYFDKILRLSYYFYLIRLFSLGLDGDKTET